MGREALASRLCLGRLERENTRAVTLQRREGRNGCIRFEPLLTSSFPTYTKGIELRTPNTARDSKAACINHGNTPKRPLNVCKTYNNAGEVGNVLYLEHSPAAAPDPLNVPLTETSCRGLTCPPLDSGGA